MNKTLIIYYSQSGQTKRMAQLIQAHMPGADICEIKVKREYAPDMWKANDQAQEELRTGNMPEIITPLPDMSKYDTILIGGPVWGMTLSNPIVVLMPQLNLKGKRVSAFWTFYDHDENYDADMRKAAVGADYVKGLSLPRRITGDKRLLDKAIEEWLKTL